MVEAPGVHTKFNRVLLRTPEGSADEFWYFEPKDMTVRSVANSNHILSHKDGKLVRVEQEVKEKLMSGFFSPQYLMDRHILYYYINGKGDSCMEVENKEDAEVKIRYGCTEVPA